VCKSSLSPLSLYFYTLTPILNKIVKIYDFKVVLMILVQPPFTTEPILLQNLLKSSEI